MVAAQEGCGQVGAVGRFSGGVSSNRLEQSGEALPSTPYRDSSVSRPGGVPDYVGEALWSELSVIRKAADALDIADG